MDGLEDRNNALVQPEGSRSSSHEARCVSAEWEGVLAQGGVPGCRHQPGGVLGVNPRYGDRRGKSGGGVKRLLSQRAEERWLSSLSMATRLARASRWESLHAAKRCASEGAQVQWAAAKAGSSDIRLRHADAPAEARFSC